MASPGWKSKDKARLSFLTNFFHIFNFILFVSGCGLVGLAVWSLVWKHDYIILVQTLIYSLTPWTLIVAAALSIIVPVLGSCAVRRYNRCLLVLYIFILLLILVIELMMGGLSWVYRDKVQFDLNNTLVDTFQNNYGLDDRYTKAIDSMQQQYKCCGAKTFEEWVKKKWLRGEESSNFVPDSCCKTESAGCGASYHPSNIPYKGCIHRLSEELEHHLVIVCAVSLGVSVIPAVGVILACWIYIKLKDHSQYNGYTRGNTRPI